MIGLVGAFPRASRRIEDGGLGARRAARCSRTTASRVGLRLDRLAVILRVGPLNRERRRRRSLDDLRLIRLLDGLRPIRPRLGLVRLHGGLLAGRLGRGRRRRRPGVAGERGGGRRGPAAADSSDELTLAHARSALAAHRGRELLKLCKTHGGQRGLGAGGLCHECPYGVVMRLPDRVECIRWGLPRNHHGERVAHRAAPGADHGPRAGA